MLSAIISKMRVATYRDFGSTGSVYKFDCICENDLMAAYAGGEENRCFTKYSPWGEAIIGGSIFSGPVEQFPGKEVYVVVTRRGDDFKCKGALAVIEARCHSMLDLGDAQAKVVEVCQSYCGEKRGFNMKTAIDNPPAVEFFEPGKDDYRVALYDASLFNRDTSLADVFAK
jgi:hypothetical protein